MLPGYRLAGGYREIFLTRGDGVSFGALAKLMR